MRSGYEIPIIGLGTWKSPINDVKNAVIEALKVGYRHIDCARFYGNEKGVGDGIQEAIKQGIIQRKDIFLTSKVFNNCHTEYLFLIISEHARLSVDLTLKELQVDYIDLLLMHWPVKFKNYEIPKKTRLPNGMPVPEVYIIYYNS